MNAEPAVARLLRQPFFWLALLTAALYSPLLWGTFVYDDPLMLTTNPAIRGIHLLRYFLDPSTIANPASGFSGDVYRPLTTLSFALDFQAWGLRPSFYHLENIFLHLANGFLFWRLLRRWLKNETEALLGAAVFLLHPVQVEVAGWIAQRSNLLAALGMLGAISFFAGAGGKVRRRNWILGTCCFAAALLCRESAIVLPVLAALVDLQGWLPKEGGRAERRILYAGLSLVSVAYLALRLGILRHWSQLSGAAPPWWENAGLGVLAFSTYLGKTLWPMALRPSYDYPEFNVWRLTAAYAAAAAYLGVLWTTRKRIPPLFTGLAWFLAGLLPVLHIIPILTFVSERFLYVPIMGAALAAVWAYRRFPAARLPLWCAVAALAASTAAAVPSWRTETSLWTRATEHEPTNAFAHACLASTLSDPVAAEREYKSALRNRPSDTVRLVATNNLAVIYLNRGEPELAATWARAALRQEPHNPLTLYNLCRAYSALGRETDAAPVCGEVARLAPNYPVVRRKRRSR